MFFFHHNNHPHTHTTICQWLCLILTIHIVHSQPIYTAKLILSPPGTQFIPVVMSAQLISTTVTDSMQKCIILCVNNVLCRVYDYEVSVTKQCRLFEGDAQTLGQIVSSSPSPQSSAGVVHLSSDLFAEYGRPCFSFCQHSRYLQCGQNFTCGCMPHTYWDVVSATCVAQSPIFGAPCQQNKSMCREDLNYTCLQFNQCGPLSLLSGTSVMDNRTTISGSATVGLDNPSGIAVFGSDNDSLIVTDMGHNRVVALWNSGTVHQNTSVVATEWAPGQILHSPRNVYVDAKNKSNLYVSETNDDLVILYTNLQSVSPLPRIVAGTNRTNVSALQRLNDPYGVQVDSHYNVIVASSSDHRIIVWPRNATTSIVIAGLGIASNASTGLNTPYGIALDEDNSLLYVADANNHRIQRYSLNDTYPRTGTTVAGGNGPGSGSHQLSNPVDIWISKKTGAMYIVDNDNNRIQRWQQGATQGVTIAGHPNGNGGTSATRLRNPIALALNTNETLMYVADRGNNRIQRFQLI